MKKYLDKLHIRILVAIAFGLLLASRFTTFQQPCTYAPPDEKISQCVGFSDVATNPGKVLTDTNVRDEFLKTFATVSIISFSLISGFYYWRRRGSK